MKKNQFNRRIQRQEFKLINFQCPRCLMKVKGLPGLKIICQKCNRRCIELQEENHGTFNKSI